LVILAAYGLCVKAILNEQVFDTVDSAVDLVESLAGVLGK